jgi:hypothetical protein
MWVLIICASVLGDSCGHQKIIPFPTKAECFEVLREMKVGNAAFAFCKPDGT